MHYSGAQNDGAFCPATGKSKMKNCVPSVMAGEPNVIVLEDLGSILLRGVPWHTTFCTRLLRRDVDDKDVFDLCGEGRNDMTGHEFTAEQLYKHAQLNVNGFILGTIAYLKGQDRTPQEWVTFIGNQFAPGWEHSKGQGARAAMNFVVLNMLSCGASFQSLTGDEFQAEAVLADWPSADFLREFGLTPEDVDPFYSIFTPIADFLNLRYEWQRTGNQLIFRLSVERTTS